MAEGSNKGGAGDMKLPSSCKLKGPENYNRWSKRMIVLFTVNGIQEYIDPKSVKLIEKLKTYEHDNAKAMIGIMLNCEDCASDLIEDLPTAVQMWTTLRDHYTGQGHNLKQLYFSEITGIRYENFDGIGSYVLQFKKLVSNLAQLKFELSNEHYIMIFINGLASAFPLWAERQRAIERDSPTSRELEKIMVDITDEARNRTINGSTQSVSFYGNQNYQAKPNNRRYCNHCNKPGHTDEKCWVLHPKKVKNINNSQNKDKGKNTDTLDFSVTAIVPKGKEINTTTSSAMSTDNTQDAQSNDWLYDTGANRHMSHDRNLFVTYKEERSQDPIKTAGGTVYAIGKGTIQLTLLKRNGSEVNMTLLNVYHLPSLTYNLFSGTMIRKRGIYFCGKTNTLRLRSDDIELAAIKEQGDKLLLMVKEVSINVVLTNTVKRISLETWHCRLGHLGYDNVKKTAKITIGMDIHGLETPSKMCKSCALSSSQRIVSTTPMERASKAFDMIHTDVINITPMTYNGHRWAAIYTDDATRVRWVVSFKEKGEAYQTTVDFINMVKTQYNRKIKRLRMDNGKEYGGQKLIDFAKQNGILLEPTVPYTPEQDGVAERTNRTLLTRVRAIAIDSKISQTLWNELLRGMVHVVNRTATSSLKNMSPIEAFDRDIKGVASAKPSVSHLRVLGCKAYVHIQKERRIQSEKLAPRAEIGYLVGFEGDHIYRIWIPTRNGITRSSTVTFDENVSEEGFYFPQATSSSLENIETRGAGIIPVNQPGPSAETQEVQNEPQATPNTGVSTPITISPLDLSITPTVPSTTQSQVQLIPPPTRGRGRPKGSKNKNSRDNTGTHTNFDMTQTSSTTSTQALILNSNNSEEGTQVPNELQDIMAFVTDLKSDIDEPRTYAQAMNGVDSQMWTQAMNEEMHSLEKNQVWTIVPPPTDTRVLKGKWVYKVKRDENNKITRYKGRWVVKGYEQQYGIDYDQTFAGVAKGMAWKTVIALAAHNNWELEQMDVVTAFLQGDVEENLYVEMPHGYEQPGMVCQLKKALYGLKQSPRNWQTRLQNVLGEAGFYPLHSDNCIFRNKDSGIIVVTYVDDFLITGAGMKKINEFKQYLMKKFEMKDLGACNYFLGIRIIRDRKARTIHLVQDAYIQKILEAFQMENSKPYSSPMEVSSLSSLIPNPGTATASDIKNYQSALGSLMYAMTQTRPDLAFAISVLSRFSHNPSPEHWKAMQRVLRYLQGTKTLGITYKGTNTKLLNLHGYSDADYAGDITTRKSTSGYIFFMANGPVSWKATRQTVVTLSSTESEYYGLTNASKEAKWLHTLLAELDYTETDAVSILIYGDNQASLAWSENPEHHQRSKHVDIQWHYIRQAVANLSVKLSYISTKEMIADGLTKPLTTARHHIFVEQLGLQSYM